MPPRRRAAFARAMRRARRGEACGGPARVARRAWPHPSPGLTIGRVTQLAFQDRYPEEYAHCFGCGRLNEHGYRLKSFWLGEETICTFTPPSHYTGGFPDVVYGGLIASLIDCHAAGSAAAAKARELGDESADSPLPRFVTASLKVDFLAPTPTGSPLEIRARIREIDGRKVFVEVSVSAAGSVTATGSALMVQISGRKTG